MQLNVFEIHNNENCIESQNHLDKNKTNFSNQCRKIYDLLMRGEVLTFKRAIVEFGVGDLRRRMKDLKDMNSVSFHCEWDSSINSKRWFMTIEDIYNNNKLITNFNK